MWCTVTHARSRQIHTHARRGSRSVALRRHRGGYLHPPSGGASGHDASFVHFVDNIGVSHGS